MPDFSSPAPSPDADLRREAGLLVTVMEQVEEMVVVTDRQLDSPGPRIVYVNPAFLRQTGYELEEVLGRTPRMLQGPLTDQRQLHRLRAALEAGEAFTGETVNYRKSGEPYDFEWHVTALRDGEGRVTHYVSIQRDVTARRRREQLERLHEAELAHVTRLTTLGELASGLAHELNQPLTAIRAYAEGSLERIKRGGADGSDFATAFEKISGQAERAGEIIRRLRGMVAKRNPRRSTVSLNELVEEVMPLAEAELHRHSIRVEMRLGEGLPPLLADAIQVEQVVLNLVRNAAEAMAGVAEDRRVLRVETLLSDEGEAVELRVVDLGVAVEPGEMHRLFQPFQTSKPGGLGIGLTLSQSIVESHGGRLTAVRNTDVAQGDAVGMTFVVRLPVGVSVGG